MVAGICVPLALFLGYILATPDRIVSVFWVVLALFLVSLPLLLRWHHALVIAMWNVQVLAFVLPGKPKAVFVLAALSIAIAIGSRTLRRQKVFIPAPATTIPLLVLAITVFLTMQMRGGLGGRVFGSETWGASRYLGVLGAIVGYFALITEPVAPNKRKLMVSIFFLSGATAILVDLLYLAGPSFYFLLSFFPDSYSYYHAQFVSGQTSLQRFAGVGTTMTLVGWFMMMRYGIKGLFDWKYPWRGMLFIGMFFLSLLGGFRGAIVSFGILFVLQFYFERLFKSYLLLVFVMTGIVGTGLLLAFSDRLPTSIQRSISFLPVKVDPVAKKDAADSLIWRLEMWRVAAPEVPKHLFLGKGYAFDGSDVYLTQLAMRRGFSAAYEEALVTGDYHQGILTLIIPLGLWGFIAFVAFCIGGFRYLHQNYLYGNPELKGANTFLLSLFVMKMIWYFIFYGEFFLDLMMLTGIVGLSLTLNGGVAHRIEEPDRSAERMQEPSSWRRLQPAFPLR